MDDDLPFGDGWNSEEWARKEKERERKIALRKQVKSEIVAFMAEAEKNGKDPINAAKAAFPAVPEGIRYQCLMEVGNVEEEAWWGHMERTIDEEVVRNALQNTLKRGS
ncbi:hypothetical protein [Methylobacterium sp. 17Sr1-1]|uniref:hypothetical protein n=1 Tax=Methylobacterium sp. 17Sr1-1 TaxID=2202826 RepID=UPI0013A57E5C|nr:hypothetical protein [Methylobacterium sp. 17Sr1-1]